jgi:hypothetical protein
MRLFQFLEFLVKNGETKQVYFELRRPDIPIDWKDSTLGTSAPRRVDYIFPVSFLDATSISTWYFSRFSHSSVTFAVGPTELRNFRLIERHYFRDTLIQSFDFTFGFCIPNTTNTWENVYSIPTLDSKKSIKANS